jgi:FkbM family methyltransferase
LLASLARYGWWQIVSRSQEIVEYEWISGAKLLVRNGMTGATGNIYCGLHEFTDMGFLLHFLQPGDLLVDAGANIGSYTVLASVVCGAEVVALEPDPDTMRSLRANVAINRAESRVELVAAALGSRTGSIQFTIGLDTTNHVATSADTQTREVFVRRLDEVLKERKPRLLKMDVEGYEGEVIAGATQTLGDSSLVAVLTENYDASVRGPLEAHGFRQHRYDPFTRTLSVFDTALDAIHGNALFVREAEGVRERLSLAPHRMVAGVEL